MNIEILRPIKKVCAIHNREYVTLFEEKIGREFRCPETGCPIRGIVPDWVNVPCSKTQEKGI